MKKGIRGERKQNEFNKVIYKGKNYVVGKCFYKKETNDFIEEFLFVFDDNHLIDFHGQLITCCDLKWNHGVNKYISSWYVSPQKDKKQLYLHNFVMNKLTHDGKGQLLTVDHINRIPTDNRLENLRELTQAEQNKNQDKRERESESMPTNSGLSIHDLPKKVYYNKARGEHGEHFTIEFDNSDFGKQIYLSSKSTEQSLLFKYAQIILILKELKTKYGKKFDDLNLEHIQDDQIELTKSYNEILKLSGFDKELITSCLEKVPEKKSLLDFDFTRLTELEQALLSKNEIVDRGGRKRFTNLPENCGVTEKDMPLGMTFKKGQGNRGDQFVFDIGRGDSRIGFRSSGTTNPSITIKQKFDEIMLEYNKNLTTINKIREGMKEKVIENQNTLTKVDITNIDTLKPEEYIIPKYCRYVQATDKRNEGYLINKKTEPKLNFEFRDKNSSRKDKYMKMIKCYNEQVDILNKKQDEPVQDKKVVIKKKKLITNLAD